MPNIVLFHVAVAFFFIFSEKRRHFIEFDKVGGAKPSRFDQRESGQAGCGAEQCQNYEQE